MSSGCGEIVGLGGAGGLAGGGEQCSVDDVGVVLLECSQRFFRGISRGFTSLEVGPGIGMPVGLGQSDPFDGAVQLAVTDSAEAMTGMI